MSTQNKEKKIVVLGCGKDKTIPRFVADVMKINKRHVKVVNIKDENLKDRAISSIMEDVISLMSDDYNLEIMIDRHSEDSLELNKVILFCITHGIVYQGVATQDNLEKLHASSNEVSDTSPGIQDQDKKRAKRQNQIKEQKREFLAKAKAELEKKISVLCLPAPSQVTVSVAAAA